MSAGEPILVGRTVTRRFGGLVAVNNVDIDVRDGEIFGLIGPNGAGKTTLFRLMSGVYRPSSGTITLRGKEIGGRAAHEVNALGIATTHQIVRPFAEMPVEKNVLVGVLYGRGGLRGRAADAEVERILELTELDDAMRRQPADALPLQQDLALERRQQARDDAERRGLAGAVAAEQRRDLALLDGEAHVPEGLHVPVRGRDAAYLEDRSGHEATARSPR